MTVIGERRSIIFGEDPAACYYRSFGGRYGYGRNVADFFLYRVAASVVYVCASLCGCGAGFGGAA